MNRLIRTMSSVLGSGNISRFLIALLPTIILCGPVPCLGAEGKDLVRWYKEKNRGLVAVKADVKQVRRLPFLEKSLVSEGSMSLDGERLIWRMERPEKTVYDVEGQSLTIRYEDLGTEKTVDLRQEPVMWAVFRNLRDILSGRLETLLPFFSLTQKPDKKLLVLTPRHESLVPLKTIRILLGGEAVLRAVRFDGLEEDWTEIQFSNVHRTFRKP